MATHQRVAYHEAGHAYIAILYRLGLRSVRIYVTSEGQWAGGVRAYLNKRKRLSHAAIEGHILRQMVGGMAGESADRILTGEDIDSTGSASDLQRLDELAGAMCDEGDEEMLDLTLEYCMKRAWRELENGWPCVVVLAEALMQYGRLTGKQARAIAFGRPAREVMAAP